MRCPRANDLVSTKRVCGKGPTELAIGHQATAAELFAIAGETLGHPLTLALDRDLVTFVECPRCGWKNEVYRPRTKVAMSEAECPACHEGGRPEIVGSIEEGTPLADRPLAGLGIPAYDIVRVDGPAGTGFFLLGGDRAAAMSV